MSGAVTDLERGRVRSLDGLRGLAALVVLEHHALLASVPSLAGPYDFGPFPRRGSLDWLLTYTPLHILWAGPEFVVVFFVLSGFVLSLPVARGGRLRIASYYPARFLRLYIPVWGALVVAAALHVAVSHQVISGGSWWLNGHAPPLDPHALWLDALLAPGAGDWGFTTVLWSLRWEVLFSLLLPVLLWLAVRLRTGSASAAGPRLRGALAAGGTGGTLMVARRPGGAPMVARRPGRALTMARRTGGALAAGLCLMALLEHGGGVVGEYLLELPPFLLGMLLAFHHDRLVLLSAALRRRTVRNVSIELALGVACVCGLTADWWLPAGVESAPLVAVGACLAVVAALVVNVFARFLESRPMRWTGKRSYSLYLVHEPLVVALAFAVGGRLGGMRFALLATALTLAAAGIFFRFVEAPAHGLARRVAARGRETSPVSVPSTVEDERLALL
jgi:peptidoglycan/LPS O-acetylase OafA/YrhL